jgi:hypothetical protein
VCEQVCQQRKVATSGEPVLNYVLTHPSGSDSKQDGQQIGKGQQREEDQQREEGQRKEGQQIGKGQQRKEGHQRNERHHI